MRRTSGSLSSPGWLSLSILILAALLSLPSGVEAWFDGLPWSREAELLLVAVVLPFFLLLERGFLSRRFVLLTLGGLLFLKVLLAISAPHSGWNIRVYATPEAMERRQWVKTYRTVMERGVSEILARPLEIQRDFPIEWMNSYNVEERHHLWLGFEVFGFARVPRDAQLALIASGLEDGSIKLLDEKGNSWDLLYTSVHQIAQPKSDRLPDGPLTVSGSLRFGPGEWSFVPVLIRQGKQVESAFGKGVLWRTRSGAALSPIQRMAFKILARVVDFGLVFFFLAWGISAFWHLVRVGVLDMGLVLLAAGGVAFSFLIFDPLQRILYDATQLFPLAVSIAVVSIGFIRWADVRRTTLEKDTNGLRVITLLVMGPAILAYFLVMWLPEVGRMRFFSLYDDWLSYQNFAREIVVEGDLWHARSQPVFIHMPLYRYFVGFLHLVFGQSTLAQNLLDVWSLLGVSVLLVSLARRLSVSPVFAVAAAGLFLVAELGSGIRHHIGRGLQEHSAMLFLMLPAWVAAHSRATSLSEALLASLLATVGFWLRLDHLSVLIGVGLLVVKPVPGSFKQAWAGWLSVLRRHKRWLAVYWGVLALALLALAFRNWVFGGRFWLVVPGINVCNSVGCVLKNFFYVLSTTQGLSDPTSDWRPALIAAVVLWPGTLLGLLALVWRPAFLARYPLGLGISLVGLMAPFLLVKIWSYPPRASIHVLPLATLSLIIILQHVWEGWTRTRRW